MDTQYVRDQLVEAYVDKIGEYLADPTSYPLFDDSTGKLVASGMEAGIFPSVPGLERKATDAGLGTGLIAQLPAFPGASMERIMEARAALEDHVARFRRAVGEMRTHLETTALEEGFQAEVIETYVREVKAAMDEIRTALKRPPVSSTLLKSLLVAAPSGVLTLGILSMAHLDAMVVTLLEIAEAGVSVGAVLTQDARQRQDAAERHELYFLYGAEQALR